MKGFNLQNKQLNCYKICNSRLYNKLISRKKLKFENLSFFKLKYLHLLYLYFYESNTHKRYFTGNIVKTNFMKYVKLEL